MISIVIIGAGNVATHLFKSLENSENFRVIQVYNRTKEHLNFFNDKVDTTSSLNDLKEAEIYILALKDDVIEAVANSLPHNKALTLHTSGATSLDALKGLERRGVLYPLQTFSKNKEVDFTEVPICIEANNPKDEDLLEQLSLEISKKVYRIDSSQRQNLHVAAVFVSNFANYMYTVGEDICKVNDIPFEILHPLMIETAEKATKIGPFAAQTGPAKRNDLEVINRHHTLLTEKQQEIYKILTKSIQDLHGKEL